MSEEQKLILISEFLEQKLRKEQELEFYLKELDELQRKIGYLKQEVSLTNTIINMIKTEKVYDIQENMIEKDKVIKFANCEELWGETPKQFPLFSEILEEKINFLKNIY